MNPQRERNQLLALAIFSYLLVIGMGILLFNCKPRSKPAGPASSITQHQIDSIRCELEIKTQRSEMDRNTAQKKSEATQTDYTQAQKRYDSISVSLP